eukprot:TRINITY_DN483_c0_g1_i4.p1 TRINITY_DN483_c0_g1~~TRINITY_DN483_c0_g1_i4.p1  ORF type:complete len:234 (+),score=30.61 TRINITY_DN483_c0_g1_i4:1181-1882(+)
MGIHGEPGAERQTLQQHNMMQFTRNLVFEICRRLDAALSQKQELVSICTGLAIMVNNLGAVPQSEMLIIAQEVSDYLNNGNGQVINGNIYPVHLFIGSFMTSLQMNGVSITCLVLSEKNEILEQLLHIPTACESWSRGFKLRPPSEMSSLFKLSSPSKVEQENGQSSGPATDDSKSGLSLQTEKYIEAITHSLLAKCGELGTLDRLTGDGDLGDTGTKSVQNLEVAQMMKYRN